MNIHPFTRDHAAAEDRRGAIEAAQLAFEAGVMMAGLGARYNNGGSASEAFGGFATAAQRKNAAPEGVLRHRLERCRAGAQVCGVESRRRAETLRVQSVFQLPADRVALAADADVGAPRAEIFALRRQLDPR